MIMLPKLFIFFYRAERQLLVFTDELASVKSKVYSLIIMSAQGYLVHIAYFQYMVNQTIIWRNIEQTCHVSVSVHEIKHDIWEGRKSKLI